MKTGISDLGDHRKRADVEAEWEEVREDYEDLLAEYSKLPVPGFRPGKAPRAAVEKHYRRPLLDDTGARCARRLSRKALDDEGIEVTGPMAVTELSIEHQGQLRFTAEFTQLPDFDLPDYGSIGLASDSDGGRRDEISMRLLEDTDIDIPREMIREELLFEGDGEAEPGGGAWASAEARVKLLLILGVIARRDGIEIDEKDLDERIGQIALAQGTDPASLRRFMLRSGGLSRLSGFLLAEKTLDYLIDINA